LSGARLRRCLISSKTVEISRAKFHEIQKTNNAHDITMTSNTFILENTWLKFDVFYFIYDIILLMLKLVSNKIDTYLTSLWRHERYLFFVFRGILPSIFRRFSKKLSTSDRKQITLMTSQWRQIRIDFVGNKLYIKSMMSSKIKHIKF
jgi:hypothetical protein